MQKQKCIWMFLGSRASKEGRTGFVVSVPRWGTACPRGPAAPSGAHSAVGRWGSWARGLGLPIKDRVCTRLRTPTVLGHFLLREASRSVWPTASFPKAPFTFSLDMKPTSWRCHFRTETKLLPLKCE